MTVRTPDSSLDSMEQRYDSLCGCCPSCCSPSRSSPISSPRARPRARSVSPPASPWRRGAWITWMVILHPGWAERPWLMGIFFVGLIAFIAVLTVRSPWFAFFTWLGFLLCVPVLDRCVAVGSLRGRGDLLRHVPVWGIPPADRFDGSYMGAAGLCRRRADRGVRPARHEDRGAESGPQGDDRRAGPGEPAAGRDDGGEHRPAGPAADPGQGSGGGGRAAANGDGRSTTPSPRA